jgi:hypothetical protein
MDHTDYLHVLPVPAQPLGWAYCFDFLDDCKKALVDGALLVKVEVEMSGYRVVTRSNTGHNLKDEGRFASDIKGLRFDTISPTSS